VLQVPFQSFCKNILGQGTGSTKKKGRPRAGQKGRAGQWEGQGQGRAGQAKGKAMTGHYKRKGQAKGKGKGQGGTSLKGQYALGRPRAG